MKWFYNLKIASKLLGAFIVVSVITAFVGFEGLTNMSTINNMLNNLYQNETRGISFIKEANVDLIYFGRAQNNYLLSSTKEERDSYLKRMDNYGQLLLKNIESAKPLITTEEGKKLIADFSVKWSEYSKVVDKITQLASLEDLNNQKASIDLAHTKGRETSDEVDTILSQLSRLKEQLGLDYYNQSDDVYAQARTFMIFLIFGAIGVGIGLGFYISRIISNPLKKSVIMIQEIGKGHLGNRLKIDSKDEVGQMALAMDNFADDLQKSVIGSMKRISEGDFNFEVPAKDKDDEIAPALNQTTNVLKNLKAETQTLTQYSLEGRLNERGRVDNFNGGYKEIVQGVNNILDAVILPVKEGSDVLKVMSTGDLTVRVKGEYKGDHQVIKNSINTLGDSLENIISEVSEAVSATASASSQISSSTEEMAAGAQEQSSQTTEVAGAVEEMTKTIIETTRNAGMASENAKGAGLTAKEGGKIVNNTVDGMVRIATVVERSSTTIKKLGESSNQIGEIIQVIDDIADQTNLLALNAAIEAARAGEQGRGFAVVADEVRKLAERTTKATKEIAVMIKQIQSDTDGAVKSIDEGSEEVQKGKNLANEAGEALKEIITATDKVLDMINMVAAASEEQSSAAEQISKNIEGISSVTQQSAAGTQQVARASEDLNRLTNNLQELINRFKINDNRNVINEKNYVVRKNGKLIEA